MEDIRVSVEFRMPDIPARVTEQEMTEMLQAHALYPGRIAKAVTDMVLADGIELLAVQIQREHDVHKILQVPDIGY